jgi:hypothetical protein
MSKANEGLFEEECETEIKRGVRGEFEPEHTKRY